MDRDDPSRRVIPPPCKQGLNSSEQLTPHLLHIASSLVFIDLSTLNSCYGYVSDAVDNAGFLCDQVYCGSPNVEIREHNGEL